MNLIKCYQTNSTWYKGAKRNSTPVGILWHDTGAGNPNLKRYVQPLTTDSNYNEMMKLLGKNQYGNDWNHIEHQAGLNAWIGKLADGSVATIQAGDWTMAPWGCGGGSKGSCNGYIKNNGTSTYSGKHWVQFEICDDGYKDKAYFEKVYKEAVELTAHICKLYGIDPKGTVSYNGVKVPTILCHADSYKLNLGSNHGDVYSWFNKMGKTMDDVRNDVAKLLGSTSASAATTFKVGDQVKIKAGVTTYTSGKKMQTWVTKATLYVREIRSDNTVVISTLKEGDVTGVVYLKDIEKIGTTSTPTPSTPAVPKEDGKIDGNYLKGSKVQLATNFASTEFDCHGKGCCSTTLVDQKLVTYLQKIRDHFGKAITINSGYRCATHNKNVGGSTGSYHTKGQAADIVVDGIKPIEVARYAEELGILGIGLYETDADGYFVHVDTRTSKSFWYGQKQAARTTFKAEEKKMLYRVRKTWADAKSQIGAYHEIANAKAACDKAGAGYYVFDEQGKAVYPEVKETAPSTTETVYYRVRKTWEDAKSQIGAYKGLANAKEACNNAGEGYHVFDGEGKIIYSAQKTEEKPVIDTSKVDTKAIDPKVMWDYFKTTGLNDYGIAGIMGNLYAESALRPCNLQQTYEKSLGMTDAEYTASVDQGIYTNFVQDKAGYGLAQWTFWSLKQQMLDYFKMAGKSIGDGQTQMEFLVHQLKTSYKTVWNELVNATSVRAASDTMLLKFERPADQSEAVQIKRAGYGQNYYDKFHIEEPKEEAKEEPPVTTPPVETPKEEPKEEVKEETPVVPETPTEEFSESWIKSLLHAILNFLLKLIGK